jgi:ABC-type transporter Mla MlaB component
VNPAPQLIKEGASEYYLRGTVKFHTVNALDDIDFQDASAEVGIDLGGLQSVDSSVIVALLQWQRQAANTDVQLRFLNIPEQIKPLIALYDLDDIIQ